MFRCARLLAVDSENKSRKWRDNVEKMLIIWINGGSAPSRIDGGRYKVVK